MFTDRLEREGALETIAQLRQQQQQQEQDLHLPHHEAARLSQQIAELATTNDELSTDLGRALDVAQRVMDQKAKLQEQCHSQEQQLLQWQLEAKRVKELEGGSFRIFAWVKPVAWVMEMSIIFESSGALLLWRFR